MRVLCGAVISALCAVVLAGEPGKVTGTMTGNTLASGSGRVMILAPDGTALQAENHWGLLSGFFAGFSFICGRNTDSLNHQFNSLPQPSLLQTILWPADRKRFGLPQRPQ